MAAPVAGKLRVIFLFGTFSLTGTGLIGKKGQRGKKGLRGIYLVIPEVLHCNHAV